MQEAEDDIPPKGAYAMVFGLLEDGSEFREYITELPTRLGRWHEAGVDDPSFISLGKTKSISREHLRISYSFHCGTFTATVVGKNGVAVGNQHYYPHDKSDRTLQTIQISHGDAIRVMSTRFYFMEPAFEKPTEYLEAMAYKQLQQAYDLGKTSMTSTEICAAIMDSSNYYRHTCGNNPRFKSLKDSLEVELANERFTLDPKTKRYSIAP